MLRRDSSRTCALQRRSKRFGVAKFPSAPEVADNDAALVRCLLRLYHQPPGGETGTRLAGRASATGPHGRSLPGGVAQLAMEAEESRERLEDTAIPRPGRRANARATLLAGSATPPSTRGRKPWRRICAHSTRTCRWNPPAMRGLPAVTERAGRAGGWTG